ncbi:MAG: hypothetical protein WCG73_01585 [Candidatus Moraniibacteriota bacterium]
MNQVVASAFRTAYGDKRVPINVPMVPGIDDQLIARADASIAVARQQVFARNRLALKKERERLDKIEEDKQLEAERISALKQDLITRAKNPDICRCAPGKKNCHVSLRHPDNGKVITRGQTDYCRGC